MGQVCSFNDSGQPFFKLDGTIPFVRGDGLSIEFWETEVCPLSGVSLLTASHLSNIMFVARNITL
jgi:hypothetical protein